MGSPTYHQWMTGAELKRFQPTTELEAVKAELAAHHLIVVSADPDNCSVKFTGRVSDFEGAFHTQLNRYQLGNKITRVALTKPQLTGATGGLAGAVTGINNTGLRPFH